MTTQQPRGISRTVTLCLQFPIVFTSLWRQLDGKTMTVLPRSLLLYCTVMFVQVYQTPTFSPHCGGNVKVKTQHIYQAMDIPVLLRGWGKQCCSQPPPKLYWPQTQNEPVHEIFNNKVCATSKASDQPAHTRSLIRAFDSRLSILWLLSYWLNTIWRF